MMGDIISIGIMCLLWIVNLFNGTGLNQVYHVTDIAKYIIVASALLMLILNTKNRHNRTVHEKSAFVFIGMFALFTFIPIYYGNGSQGFDYVWVYLLIYAVSKMNISEKAFKMIGICYGFFGAVVLIIYNYGNLFAGWNDNSIAMIGMHSFLIFIIPFFKKSYNYINQIIIVISTCVFMFLLNSTNSRSCLIFLLMVALLGLNLIPRKILVGTNKKRMFFLLFPLILAVALCLVSGTELAVKLNDWSIEQFNKTAFSGRDEIWLWGFDILKEHPLFGTGNLIITNWHNSAMTCLTFGGIIGYVFWILSFNEMLNVAAPYTKDYIVMGSMISFFMLYMQQAVELGFISVSPNVLPYILLGLMLGRARYIKSNIIN